MAGSVDYAEDYGNLAKLIDRSLGAEISEELNLRPDEYEIIPLAFAREIFRGEKPQLFCLVKTSLSRIEIAERLSALDPDAREFDSFDFVAIDRDRVSLDSWLAAVNHEARMNYHLVEEYLEMDR